MTSKRVLQFAGVVAVALVLVGRAEAVVLNLTPCALSTAQDSGPQNGIFDQFVPGNLGSVNNNGFTSFATSMQFCLPVLPAGAVVNSANVIFSMRNSQGNNRSLARAIYAGDGTVKLSDFVVANISRRTLIPEGVSNLSDDIGSYLPSLGRFVGYTLFEDPANTANYLVMAVALVATEFQAPPVLRLDYSVESKQVPTLSEWSMLTLPLLLMLFGFRQIRRTGNGARRSNGRQSQQ